MSQQNRTFQFMKLRVDSFHGKGAGLRHLSFSGIRVKKGKEAPYYKEEFQLNRHWDPDLDPNNNKTIMTMLTIHQIKTGQYRNKAVSY